MNKTSVLLAVIAIPVMLLFAYYFFIQENFEELKNPIEDNVQNTSSQNYDSPNIGLEQKILGNLELIKSPYVTEYNLPNGTWPLGILVSSSGDVWIGGTKSHNLLLFDALSEKIQNSYPIPNYSNTESINPEMIWTIVEDKDGLIWFSQTGKNPLWIFNPINEEFALKNEVQSAAIQMEVSPTSGNIWFTDTDQDIIGVIQKDNHSNSYAISEFPMSEGAGPFGLYIDSNEGIWVTQPTNGVIYQYHKTVTNNTISEISPHFELRASNNTVFYTPSDVLVNENKVWFTEHLTNYFLEYERESGELQRYPTSINPHHYGTLPFWMKWDIDKQGFWFVEHFGNRIAFFNTTDYSLTEYEIPTRDPDWGYIANAVNISLDPTNSDKLWFSELYTDKIGVVDAGIKVPFDLEIEQETLRLDNHNSTAIDFVISVNTLDTPIQNNALFLKKSSTIVASGEFGNMTAKFDANRFEVNGIEKYEGKLVFSNYQNMGEGIYKVSISVTDGTVTKTRYFDIIIS